MSQTTHDDPIGGPNWWRLAMSETDHLDLRQRFDHILEEHANHLQDLEYLFATINQKDIVQAIHELAEVDCEGSPVLGEIVAQIGRQLTAAYADDPNIPPDDICNQMHAVWWHSEEGDMWDEWAEDAEEGWEDEDGDDLE